MFRNSRWRRLWGSLLSRPPWQHGWRAVCRSWTRLRSGWSLATLPSTSIRQRGRSPSNSDWNRCHPHGVYAVVDSYGNRFTIWHGSELLRQSPCSTGTGSVLRDPRTGRLWVFDTPSGEHSVSRKVTDPVWIRPDWSFLEQGLEPPPGLSGRRDDFSLGDFGLYLGDGHIIHGTIFQTLLGQSATHGCIRLGKEDLANAYEHLVVGSRVFVF